MMQFLRDVLVIEITPKEWGDFDHFNFYLMQK